MNISNKNNIKGFTLIETLVAIGILMMAVVGPISVAYKSLKSSMVAKDQFTASYLAQDAIEYMKALAIKKNALPICGGGLGTEECDVDTTISLNEYDDISDYIISCDTTNRNDGCRLVFDADKYYYPGVVTAPSPFTRKIRTKEVSPNEVSVEVTVSFLSGKSTIPNYVTIYSNIFIP